MATGFSQHGVCKILGGSQTIQSHAIIKFINHLYFNFSHLVKQTDTSDPLHWWFRNGLVEESAQLIEDKLCLGNKNLFAFFIDCNCLETSRPGGGPTERGVNAARWDPRIQESFYNGWKSFHGLMQWG